MKIKSISLILAIIALSGCSSYDTVDFYDSTPAINYEEAVETNDYDWSYTEEKNTYQQDSYTYNNSVDYYTNVDGYKVQSPTYYDYTPSGATAECRDGTYSFSMNRSGTCSHHGGVATWLIIALFI